MSALLIALCLAIVFPVHPVPAAEPAPVRLAILSADAAVNPIADLLTVELSRTNSIVLLERQQIERVLREQSLSATSTDYVRLGQLLGADGLLILRLENRGANQVLAARMVASRPGVVLAVETAPWPLENASEWTRLILPQFRSLLPKLSVLAKDAVPISVLGLRSALQTEQQKSLEKQLTLLLIHRLARERDIFVLERQHLEQALFEKQLLPEQESPFWTGRYLLDGTLDQDGFQPDRVTINARLSPPGAGAPMSIELSGPRTNLPAVAESIVTRILSSLRLESAATDWRPRDEANQYFDEAKWAYRWRLLPEAKAAAEAAWALGLRSQEVALLRIQTYVTEIFNGRHVFYHHYPDPLALPRTIHAVTLFNEDIPRFVTDKSGTNRPAFDMGMALYGTADAVLRMYRFHAEARPGNEALLADLRAAVRRMDEFLAAHFVGGPIIVNSGRRNALKLARWSIHGFIHEEPEDALAGFVELIESGHVPERRTIDGTGILPRTFFPDFAAWNWEDRRRIPSVKRKFVERLLASTNAAARLKGGLLAVELTPFDGSGKLEAVTRDFCDQLWKHREVMYSGEEAWLVGAATETLENKYGINGYLDREPFRSLRQRIRVDYLTNPAVSNEAALSDLVTSVRQRQPISFDPRGFSPEEAAELEPLVKAFTERTRSRRPPPALNFPPTRPVPTPPTVGPSERVQFVPWKTMFTGIDPDEHPLLKGSLFRHGKLWVYLRFERRWNPGPGKVFFVGVHPETGAGEVIPLPPEFGMPDSLFSAMSPYDPCFEVTDKILVAGANTHIVVYDFGKKAWEQTPIPVQEWARPRAVGNKIYVADKNALLEWDPATGASEILASGRRRPPANSLDELMEFRNIFPTPDGRLGLVVKTQVFLFNPRQRTWKELSFPNGKTLREIHWNANDHGVAFRTIAGSKAGLALRKDDSVELLIERPADPERWGRGREGVGVPEPVWNWPQEYDLFHIRVMMDGGALWALDGPATPRLDRTLRHSIDPHATLFRFEPDFKPGLRVGLQFEKDGRLFNPATPGPEVLEMDTFTPAIWIATPRGLAVVGAGVNGHWFLPREQLEKRLEQVRAELRKQPDSLRAAAEPREAK